MLFFVNLLVGFAKDVVTLNAVRYDIITLVVEVVLRSGLSAEFSAAGSISTSFRGENVPKVMQI